MRNMFMSKVYSYVDAWFPAKSNVPLERYMEDKLTQFMRKVSLAPGSPYSIETDADGRGRIIDNSTVPEEENEDDGYDPVDPFVQIKLEQANIELSALDRRIREQEEGLASLRDEENVGMDQISQFRSLRRDSLLALVSFIVLSLGELGAITFFLADWFSIDSSRLISEAKENPLGVGLLVTLGIALFGILLVIATKIVKAKREEKYLECGFYFGILLACGIVLGVMRSLQISRGELNLAVLAVSGLIATGVPIAAAIVKLWWMESARKLQQIETPIEGLKKQIRESTARLRELERLRRNAERRRDNLIRSLEISSQRNIQRQQTRREQELASLRLVLAKLSMYRGAYMWHSRKIKEVVRSA
jgi:hypothetical protein